MNQYIPIVFYFLIVFFSMILKFVINADFLNISNGESKKLSVFETMNYVLSLIPILGLKTHYVAEKKIVQLIEFIVKIIFITFIVFMIFFKQNTILYAFN